MPRSNYGVSSVVRVLDPHSPDDAKVVNFGCTGDLNPASEPISVVSATDGKACGASRGNADYAVSTLCDGKDSCDRFERAPDTGPHAWCGCSPG